MQTPIYNSRNFKVLIDTLATLGFLLASTIVEILKS